MSQNKPNQNLIPARPLFRAGGLLFFTVFGVVLALYWLTLAPGVVGGDAGEHQFAVPLLGIPHTTGYPLYVLAGKLWTILIPVGSMAWRMNLFSAVNGALAAGTTALVVFHLARQRPDGLAPAWFSGLVAGVTLAAGLTLWQWSIIAGVRSMNVLFFALLTLEAVIWQQQRRQGNPAAAWRTLCWLAFTVGLSLAHHRTTIFYLPSLAGWVWWHHRKLIFRPRRWLVLAGLAVAPLLLYGFIYVRGVNNPPYTHEPIYNLQSFWFLVGSGDSKGLFFSIDPAFLPARLAFIWGDILRQLSLPGVILAALGGLFLLWQQRRHFFFQAGLVVLLLLFTLDFEVVNLNEAPTWYLMPAYFIFAVWLGMGVHGLWAALGPRLARLTLLGRRRVVGPALYSLAVMGLLGVTLAWPNWQQIYTDSTAPLDEWRQRLRGDQARRFVEAGLPFVEPNSIILGDWEQYTPFNYYQFIHGLRRDVSVRNPLNRWPEQVAAARAGGRPVYFARKTTDLIGTPYLSMVGPLIHLRTGPAFDAPPDIIPLNASFEDELELVGYQARVVPQYTPGGSKAGPIIQLWLYWRAFHRLEWDYAVSLRLLDPAGQEQYKRDAAHPVLSSYPTSLWTPGEVVGDFYELPFRPGTGPLTLHLLPYRSQGPGQWHNLRLQAADPPQEGIFLGPFVEP